MKATPMPGKGQLLTSESWGDTVAVDVLPQGGLAITPMSGDKRDERGRIVLDKEQADLIASLLLIDEKLATAIVSDAILRGIQGAEPLAPRKRPMPGAAGGDTQAQAHRLGLLLLLITFSLGMFVGASIW